MTNNLVLPLLALTLAILAALFPLRHEDQPPPVLRQRIRDILGGTVLAVGFVLSFLAATLIWPKIFANGTTVALALGIGTLAGSVAAAVDASRSGFAVGLAIFGAAIMHLLPAAGSEAAQVAFVAGTFIAAFATNGLQTKLASSYLCALSSLLVVAVDFLGRKASVNSESAASAGVALGIAFLVTTLVTGVSAKLGAKARISSPIGFSALGFVVLVTVGYVACWRFLGRPELGILWIGGAVVGGLVHLILSGEDQADSFRFVLCTVIWLGAATVAFGMHLGYGMAITVLGGACSLVLFGNIRGLMTICVPATVLVYRLFREMYPDEAKAPDIGQHYTMIGIAVGALLPLLPLEWVRGRSISGWRALSATKVWLLILLGLPIAAAVLLGSKGAIGMVIGLGFAAVIDGLRGSISLAPVGIATGVGAITVLSYGWLGDWMDLDRAIKVKAVIGVGVAALVLSGALVWLSHKKPVKETA